MSATIPELAKIQGVDLPGIVGLIDLPPEARDAVARCTAAPEALEELIAAGFLIEATRLLAQALPKREAVWWACMCARHVPQPDPPEADIKALEAAEHWVRRQTDELRREAMAHAQESGFGTPECWAAVAAFWSGDSMAPPGQPAVPPAPHLAGRAVAGAVALASVRTQPERATPRLRNFLASGREIAAGGPGRLAPEAD